MNDKVSIDTQIMIWGIKREAIPEQREMINRACSFFDKLEEDGAKVIISPVVVGELLCQVPAEKRNNVLRDFRKNFMISSFDYKTALNYADIWYTKKGDSEEAISNRMNAKRQHIKADIMIAASALSAEAAVLYTNDDGLKKVSEGFIPARDLPALPSQPYFQFNQEDDE